MEILGGMVFIIICIGFIIVLGVVGILIYMFRQRANGSSSSNDAHAGGVIWGSSDSSNDGGFFGGDSTGDGGGDSGGDGGGGDGGGGE